MTRSLGLTSHPKEGIYCMSITLRLYRRTHRDVIFYLLCNTNSQVINQVEQKPLMKRVINGCLPWSMTSYGHPLTSLQPPSKCGFRQRIINFRLKKLSIRIIKHVNKRRMQKCKESFIITPLRYHGEVVFSLQFVYVCVFVCVCVFVSVCLSVC